VRAIQHLMMLADQVVALTADNTELRAQVARYEKSLGEFGDEMIAKQAEIIRLTETVEILRRELRNIRRCHLN